MSKSLTLKYRPNTFTEVCGQSITTKILEKVIETKSFKNSMLFAGPSGTGKTTLARIVANRINNNIGAPIEIDCASNNSIESVRAIVADANQRSLTGEYKVYILDECHAFSTAAWQAFLKCIEECPTYTIFIFCTTEVQKIPSTILNRVQRYNIAPIPTDEIFTQLKFICQQEGFSNFEDTCDLIAKVNHGGMRDAITMLEQCADFSTDLSLSNAKQVIGELSYETMLQLTNYILDRNEQEILLLIDTLYNQGKDLKQFINVYLEFLLDLVKYSIFKNISVTAIPKYLEKVSDSSISVQYVTNIEGAQTCFNALVNRILEIKMAIKYDTSYKATIEAMLIKLCRG